MLKQQLHMLIERLQESDLKTVEDYVQFLIQQSERHANKGKSTPQNRRISLRGIITGSQVTDQDLVETKSIWR